MQLCTKTKMNNILIIVFGCLDIVFFFLACVHHCRAQFNLFCLIFTSVLTFHFQRDEIASDRHHLIRKFYRRVWDNPFLLIYFSLTIAHFVVHFSGPPFYTLTCVQIQFPARLVKYAPQSCIQQRCWVGGRICVSLERFYRCTHAGSRCRGVGWRQENSLRRGVFSPVYFERWLLALPCLPHPLLDRLLCLISVQTHSQTRTHSAPLNTLAWAYTRPRLSSHPNPLHHSSVSLCLVSHR